MFGNIIINYNEKDYLNHINNILKNGLYKLIYYIFIDL
jgi:hypothetical protein